MSCNVCNCCCVYEVSRCGGVMGSGSVCVMLDGVCGSIGVIVR